jgi:hypothetical protein
VVNGPYAKWGYRNAMRHGTLERLQRLADEGTTVARPQPG